MNLETLYEKVGTLHRRVRLPPRGLVFFDSFRRPE